MKKSISLLLAAAMVFAFAACGTGGTKTPGASGTADTADTPDTSTPEEPTGAEYRLVS